MRVDWVPVSAAMLVTGAMALVLGTFLTPAGETATQTLRLIEAQDGRWMAVAVMYFLAAVTLILGLPTVLTLFGSRGQRTAIASVLVLSIGYVGVAGYAMVLVFFRALVLSDAVRADRLSEASENLGLVIFLIGWVAAFYIGELLLAVALLRAGVVAVWIPLALLAHIALLPIAGLLPDGSENAGILFVAAAYSGIAIAAVDRGRPV
ncbi:hypothetical protein [Nocardioides pacificus]